MIRKYNFSNLLNTRGNIRNYKQKPTIIEKNFKILKSRIGFEKWTFLKMSKMKNLEIVLKITFQFYNCDEDALKYFKKC